MHPRVALFWVRRPQLKPTRSMVSSVTGFSHKQLPIKGVPMVSGRFRVAYFHSGNNLEKD